MRNVLQIIKNWVSGNDPEITSDDVLTQDQLKRIKQIRELLKEVEKNSLRIWIENFKKDRNPNSEISVWECIAETYSTFISGKVLNQRQKSEAFSYALSCSFTQDLTRLENETPKHIPKGWIKEITALFRKIADERFPKG